jgi:hypothetical protein
VRPDESTPDFDHPALRANKGFLFFRFAGRAQLTRSADADMAKAADATHRAIVRPFVIGIGGAGFIVVHLTVWF